jgi:hypothetical protein
MLPLDLHVLSLPLAFILSQDQTLRCIKVFNTDSISKKFRTKNILLFLILFIMLPIFSKNL